jgi:hypothetical protein
MRTPPICSGGAAFVLASPAAPVEPTTIARSSGLSSAMRLASPRPTAASTMIACTPSFFSAATASLTAGMAGEDVTPSRGLFAFSALSGAATPMMPTFTPLIVRTVYFCGAVGACTFAATIAAPLFSASFGTVVAPPAHVLREGAKAARFSVFNV